MIYIVYLGQKGGGGPGPLGPPPSKSATELTVFLT